MDLQSKISLSSWDKDAWMHIPGAMAWAPLPPPHPSLRNRTTHDGKELWPCILYPSWSDALRSSGVPVPDQLLLLGCKNPVPTSKLKKNIVPGKMALGSSEMVDTEHGSCKRRKKLVCYFLGMDDRGWCAVHTKDVQRYERDRCIEILKTYKGMTGIETENSTKIWEDLVVAMKEASLALSNPQYDPSILCKSLDIETKGSMDADDDGSNANVDSCTPECFDDWKVGGNTQSMTMTQGASRFSLQTQTQSKSQG